MNFADKLNLSSRPVNFALAGSAQSNEDDADEPLQGEDREFLDWLLDRAGVSVTHYRPESLARRLPSCLRVLRASSPAHARSMIERNRLLTSTAVNSVLIGVTSFFRDGHVFDHLDEHVLARFADRASARIWSVGCSDGMELYTVAMQLAQRRVLHRCQLLGTDCRLEATRFAAGGTYTTQALQDVPDLLRDAYFSPHDKNAHAIHPIIRGSVQWRTADVLRTPEPGPWDLILCRNKAMYMRGDAVARLWGILENSLRPGGYLVLGKAERPNGASSLSNVAPCIFRRVKG